MSRRMTGFEELTTLETAIKKLRQSLTHRITETETINTEHSDGRILGEDIKAVRDIPEYDRSTVDGYAVVAEDTYGASPTNPTSLIVIAEIVAGTPPEVLPTITRGTAARIMTGGPIPGGATAVVMSEHAQERNGLVEITKQVHPYQNVSRRGEDFREGEIIAKRGTRIRPWHIAAIIQQEITMVRVLRRPRVAVMTTGEELVELGKTRSPGQMVDTNRPMLKVLLVEDGALPIDLGNVPDDKLEIVRRIKAGLSVADAVIVTGGTSLGERDEVPEAVSSLGSPGVVVHGLRIRPAKPTGYGIVNGKPIFMLSGFPVSSYIGYKLLVKPSISIMMGTIDLPPPRVRGRLTRRVAKPTGIRAFVRVRVERIGGELMVEPLMLTGSGLLSTLTMGNGVLEISENLEGHDEGEEVEVELTQPLEEIGDGARLS